MFRVKNTRKTLLSFLIRRKTKAMCANLHSIQNERIVSQSSDAQSKTKSVCLEVFISPESDFFDGHFPAFKLFPAVAQIYLVDRFAKKYLGLEGFAKEIKRVKFPSPVMPGATVLLSLEQDLLSGTLSFSICDSVQKDKVYSSGTAVL